MRSESIINLLLYSINYYSTKDNTVTNIILILIAPRGGLMNPRGDVNDPQGERNYSLFHYFPKTRKTTIYSPLPGECETSSYTDTF